MGAFGIASLLERADNSGNDIQDLRGLWYRRPVMAGLLAFFLLGLAGFPPMAGFAGKYYIFYAALNSGHPELLIIGVLASILGMYYYLRIIAAMFMEGDSALAQVLGLGDAPTATISTTAPPRVPATPRGYEQSSTGRLATSSSTAVAVKTPTAALPKTPHPLSRPQRNKRLQGASVGSHGQVSVSLRLAPWQWVQSCPSG